MRVLCITPYYKPSWFYGGPPRCIAELNENLVSRYDITIEVLTLNLNGEKALYTDAGIATREVNGVTVHYLPPATGRIGRAYFGSPLLDRWLKGGASFDLVHVNTLFNAFSRKGMQYAVRKGTPFVVTPHGMLDAYSLSRSAGLKKLHRRLFDDRLLAAAGAVHFTTENEQRNAILPPGIKPAVIPLGFEFPSAVPARESAGREGVRLVFLGRINRKKGIDLLMRGLADMLPEDRKRIMIDVFGLDDEGAIPELMKLNEHLGLQQQIRFKGALDPAERDATLSAYDALVLTSHQENFGLVVTEALSIGLPVYVSDKVNLCDFVSDNKCGWVSTLDPGDIARTLAAILHTDGPRRLEMGRTGMEAVRREFDIQAVAPRYKALYDGIAGVQ